MSLSMYIRDSLPGHGMSGWLDDFAARIRKRAAERRRRAAQAREIRRQRGLRRQRDPRAGVVALQLQAARRRLKEAETAIGRHRAEGKGLVKLLRDAQKAVRDAELRNRAGRAIDNKMKKQQGVMNLILAKAQEAEKREDQARRRRHSDALRKVRAMRRTLGVRLQAVANSLQWRSGQSAARILQNGLNSVMNLHLPKSTRDTLFEKVKKALEKLRLKMREPVIVGHFPHDRRRQIIRGLRGMSKRLLAA